MQQNPGIDILRKDQVFLKLIKYLETRGVFCLIQNPYIYIIYKSKTGSITLESVGEEGEDVETKKQKLKNDFGYSDDLKKITFPERIEEGAFSLSFFKKDTDTVYTIKFAPHDIESELCRLDQNLTLKYQNKPITIETLRNIFEEIEEKIKQEALYQFALTIDLFGIG